MNFLDIIACYIKIADLTLKPGDHYGNVIRLEKFRSDMEFTRFGPGNTFIEGVPESIIRTVNAFYRQVFFKLYPFESYLTDHSQDILAIKSSNIYDFIKLLSAMGKI